jgi:hypothetical protein
MQDMDAFSKFQTTNEKPIWILEPATTHCIICPNIGCYTNCYEDGKGPHLNGLLEDISPLVFFVVTHEMCPVCNHPISDHLHSHLKWEETIDTQVVIDPDMQAKWENAKNDKERKEILLSSYQQALDGFNQRIDDGTKELAELVEGYAELSLSGSFSVQVEKAAALLEQSYKSMEQKGVDQEQLQKMKEGLDMMVKKLELLKEAKEKRQEEVQIVR